MIQKSLSLEDLFPIESLQSLADNVGSLIERNIVIYNRVGTIIAATNHSRIGVHGNGISKMIDEDSPMYVIHEVDSEGLLPGVSQPIQFENDNIGALGITGQADDVLTFCRVVRSFVQQQLVAIAREKENSSKRQQYNNFVYSCIYGDIKHNFQDINLRGHALGIDTSLPRVAAVIRIPKSDEQSSLQYQVLLHLVSHYKTMLNTSVAGELGDDIVIFFNSVDVNKVRETCQLFKESIYHQFKILVATGIGSPAKDITDVALSYDAAKLACNASEDTENKQIMIFGTFDIELLLSTADQEHKQRIYNYIFRNYSSERQIEESIEILKNYVEYNRSISEIATKLNLHKNTVQFRLNRIFDLTEHNPRETKDLLLLYTVVLLHEMGIRLTSI